MGVLPDNRGFRRIDSLGISKGGAFGNGMSVGVAPWYF